MLRKEKKNKETRRNKKKF